jgi:hypothetical protein
VEEEKRSPHIAPAAAAHGAVPVLPRFRLGNISPQPRELPEWAPRWELNGVSARYEAGYPGFVEAAVSVEEVNDWPLPESLLPLPPSAFPVTLTWGAAQLPRPRAHARQVWIPGVGWYVFAEDGFLAPTGTGSVFLTDQGFDGRNRCWLVDSVWHEEGRLPRN